MSQASAGIVVACGSCGSRLRVREEAVGKIGKCPKCGCRFQIAIPAPAPKKPEAPPKEAPATTPRGSIFSPGIAGEGKSEGQFVESSKFDVERSMFNSTSNVQRSTSNVELPSPQPSPGIAGKGENVASSAALNDDDWKRGMSPEVLREIEAEKARLGAQGSISIGILVFASLVAGAAICFQVARYGGAEHWVVKRSVAAWLVGMMTAGAMLVSSAHRGGAVRFLAAVTAAAAVIGGKLFTAPVAAYQPIDLLLLILAIAGSTFTFMLAEPSKSRPAQTASLPAGSTT